MSVYIVIIKVIRFAANNHTQLVQVLYLAYELYSLSSASYKHKSRIYGL